MTRESAPLQKGIITELESYEGNTSQVRYERWEDEAVLENMFTGKVVWYDSFESLLDQLQESGVPDELDGSAGDRYSCERVDNEEAEKDQELPEMLQGSQDVSKEEDAKGRYDFLNTENDQTVIYDRENPQGWIQAGISVSFEEIR